MFLSSVFVVPLTEEEIRVQQQKERVREMLVQQGLGDENLIRKAEEEEQVVKERRRSSVSSSTSTASSSYRDETLGGAQIGGYQQKIEATTTADGVFKNVTREQQQQDGKNLMTLRTRNKELTDVMRPTSQPVFTLVGICVYTTLVLNRYLQLFTPFLSTLWRPIFVYR